MAKFWCIKCQDEVEHQANYCHSRCGNNCDQVCSRCHTTSLTTKMSDPRDSDIAALRWATGEAQRLMKEHGVIASMEVAVPKLGTDGIPYDRSASYNPADGLAKFRT